MNILFNTLLFLIPLIFYKNTSELFEFNKTITLYTFTTLIVAVWAKNSITHKKFIFRRTILDIPLLLYLLSLLISTLFSIDPRTSWLGYYSRFNGGLLSQICYALLYWAYVSNMTTKQSLISIRYSLIATAIASTMAIMEHFGFFATCGPIRHALLFDSGNQNEITKYLGFNVADKIKYLFTNSCWVQDVQNRVFSTLGQPNWLAALTVILIPVSWAYGLKNKKYHLFSILFFVTLLFTKSRSGLLASGIETLIFWGYIIWKEKFKYIKDFTTLLFISITLVYVTGLNFKPVSQIQIPQNNSLETGGTESGTIRKYVWIGALNIFKNYPMFGSGVETFAFSFPKYKPIEHNLTSEWDFIYNKAHNEYLNYLATTGIFGFIAYLTVIFYSLKILASSKKFELIAGFVAILITNFFGFSVVPVSLLFFLIPAMAQINDSNEKIKISEKLNKNKSRLIILATVLASLFSIYLIFNYWRADIYYNNARDFNKKNKTEEAKQEISRALDISPNEPLYIAELSFATKDVELSAKALDLNPYNQNVRNILISNLNSKSKETKEYLTIAEQIAEVGTDISPMNPKTYYQLGILNLKNNNLESGLSSLEKAVLLKPNYKEGRFALGLTYIDIKKYEKAKENLEYILKNIDPNDELTKKYLDQAKSASE